MNIEMPIFGNTSEADRISQIEKWIYNLAEQIASAPFQISGFERGRVSDGSDEITITYPDGSRVSYTLTKAERT